MNRSTGSRLLTIVVAVIVIWLALKLLGVALKLVGLLILIGAALVVYLGVQRLIGKGR